MPLPLNVKELLDKCRYENLTHSIYDETLEIFNHLINSMKKVNMSKVKVMRNDDLYLFHMCKDIMIGNFEFENKKHLIITFMGTNSTFIFTKGDDFFKFAVDVDKVSHIPSVHCILPFVKRTVHHNIPKIRRFKNAV